jgi:hypothetical protein
MFTTESRGKKRMIRSLPYLLLSLLLITGLVGPRFALAANKFEKEVEMEAAAVKLLREAQRGGYDLVTTAEL